MHFPHTTATLSRSLYRFSDHRYRDCTEYHRLFCSPYTTTAILISDIPENKGPILGDEIIYCIVVPMEDSSILPLSSHPENCTSPFVITQHFASLWRALETAADYSCGLPLIDRPTWRLVRFSKSLLLSSRIVSLRPVSQTCYPQREWY